MREQIVCTVGVEHLRADNIWCCQTRTVDKDGRVDNCAPIAPRPTERDAAKNCQRLLPILHERLFGGALVVVVVVVVVVHTCHFGAVSSAGVFFSYKCSFYALFERVLFWALTPLLEVAVAMSENSVCVLGQQNPKLKRHLRTTIFDLLRRRCTGNAVFEVVSYLQHQGFVVFTSQRVE